MGKHSLRHAQEEAWKQNLFWEFDQQVLCHAQRPNKNHQHKNKAEGIENYSSVWVSGAVC